MKTKKCPHCKQVKTSDQYCRQRDGKPFGACNQCIEEGTWTPTSQRNITNRPIGRPPNIDPELIVCVKCNIPKPVEEYYQTPEGKRRGRSCLECLYNPIERKAKCLRNAKAYNERVKLKQNNII